MSDAAASRGRILYQLARADFLERVRRYSFLFTLGIAVYLGYAAASGQLVMQINDSRGVFNSAWIGGLMALVATTFLSLAGFYVVKNTIERDRSTRVGEILASTPITRTLYVMGKTASNFAVLAVMVLILAVSGIIMQFWRAEDPHVDLWKLLAPFLLIALPAMAMVAAIGVLFETIPWLRGGFGNVVYFFVWCVGLAVPVSAAVNLTKSLLDWPGLSLIFESLRSASQAPVEHSSFTMSIGSNVNSLSIFRWDGIAWTTSLVLSRLVWFGAALAIAFFAALLFDRFDPARGRMRGGVSEATPSEDNAEAEKIALHVPAHAARLTPLTAAPASFRFGAMLVAEVRLMLKGQKWWWYVVALGFIVASAAVPSAEGRGLVLACAWIWPVLLWSSMGVREFRDQTSQLLFSAPHPIARQLPAVWLAGVILALLTGSGFALRLLLGGNMRGLLAWLIGALFIPTLALALGVWSGSSKLFEIVYTLLWYVGPMHAISQLDFMGSAPGTAMTRAPLVYLLLTIGMVAVALAGRKRQLQT
jgi:hypothetical protein